MNEISIVPFRFKYLPALKELHAKQHSDVEKLLTMKLLPKIGYVALMSGHPIAAGFLRRVEGGYGQIDTLVSNPYFGSLVRHEAINKVVAQLIEDAKDLNLHGIIAYTTDDTVVKRSLNIGFEELPHRVIALKL